MPESTCVHYQEELEKLEEQALGGLDMVVETLDRTMEALEQHDIELATMVIEDDDRIDGRYLEVHQGILSLLARQAPVATDLRLVAALLDSINRPVRRSDSGLTSVEKNAVASETLAACCMLWVTITIE